MQLIEQLPSRTADVYFSEDFRNVIESYLPYLRTHRKTVVISVNPHAAYKYEFDFYGLLYSMKISEVYHWIIMRINNIVSPMDFNTEMMTLLVPDGVLIDQIRAIHSAQLTAG